MASVLKHSAGNATTSRVMSPLHDEPDAISSLHTARVIGRELEPVRNTHAEPSSWTCKMLHHGHTKADRQHRVLLAKVEQVLQLLQ